MNRSKIAVRGVASAVKISTFLCNSLEKFQQFDQLGGVLLTQVNNQLNALKEKCGELAQSKDRSKDWPIYRGLTARLQH